MRALDRAEGVLDRLTPLTHRLRVLVETTLHRLDDMLVLPSRDPALLARGALILDSAGPARVRPIATQLLSVLNGREVVFEMLAGGAAVDVLFGQIDEVLLAEAAVRLRARRHRLRQCHQDTCTIAGQDSSPLK
jgi:hypothetical protein